MPSAIDITKPIYGTPTTQSVRDNFTIARDEITDLQDLADTHVNRGGDTMNGPLILYGDPYAQNEAATLSWVLRQLHSSINTLIYIGDYDGVTDVILSSGQPQFIAGQPLPAASSSTSQYYFTVKTGHASPGIGNQPSEGVTAGTFLISNGVKWINYAMTAANVTAKTTPIDAPPIPNVPGANVYDALAGIGQNYVMKSGATMIGDLNLRGAPTTLLMASTKKYVDDLITGLVFPGEAPRDGLAYARKDAGWTSAPFFTGIKIDTTSNPIFTAALTLNTTVASNLSNQILGTKNNVLRWIIQPGDQTVNHDFGIIRYDNSGINLDYSNGGYALKIDRLAGSISFSRSLYFDCPVTFAPSISGRGANNPTNPTDDTLNIWSRFNLGGGNTGAVIGLRGPIYTPNPNSIEIITGATSNMAWSFRADGTLYTPGAIVIPQQKGYCLDLQGTSYLTKDGANAVILWADSANRFLFYPGGLQWSIQGPPNLRDVATFHTDTGNMDLLGSINCINITANGAVSTGSSIISNTGIIQSNVGRFVSTCGAGNYPTFCCWPSSQGYAAGMMADNARLYFGSMNGDGTWAGTTYGYLQHSDSSFSVDSGPIATNGRFICQDTGVQYANIGASGFNFRWADGLIYGRVDNAVDFAISNNSDERLKVDIELSKIDCLAAVMKTPLFQFKFRDGSDTEQLFTAEPMVGAKLNPIGFVAQKQYEVFPESVIKGSDEIGDGIEGATTIWSMDTNTLLATAFGAIKQLYQEVLELKGKLK